MLNPDHFHVFFQRISAESGFASGRVQKYLNEADIYCAWYPYRIYQFINYIYGNVMQFDKMKLISWKPSLATKFFKYEVEEKKQDKGACLQRIWPPAKVLTKLTLVLTSNYSDTLENNLRAFQRAKLYDPVEFNVMLRRVKLINL